MENKIYKYFFYVFFRYFSITLFALAIIVWTIQSVNYLDLVTEDGHAFLTYFAYSLLSLSKVLTKLIPFCFLISLTFTILKLEKDNELIIIWTSGLNKIHIVNLIFRIAIAFMFIQLLFTSLLNPYLLNKSRSLLKNSELNFVPSLLKAKQFNDTVKGLTIFVDEKDESGIYKNIFIRDDSNILSSLGTTSSTIFAKSGYITDGEKNLILHSGNIQKLKNDNTVDIVKFEKTVLTLSGLTTKSIIKPKIQETSTLKIFQCINYLNVTPKEYTKRQWNFLMKEKNISNCQRTKKFFMNIKIELNKRFGMPIFIPLISLICSFLLSSRKEEKINFYNKYIFFSIGFAMLLLAEIFVRYSGISWTNTFIYYLLPLGMLPLFYLRLIRKFKYENLF